MHLKQLALPISIAGFLLTAAFAVTQKWSLQEFCWSSWLAGLMFSWACVATGAIQIVLTPQATRRPYADRLPFLHSIPPLTLAVGLFVLVPILAMLVFRVYGMVFGFYGLFLSVFAEMEPLSLFGRDGFINADFTTSVLTLLRLFWPMVAGTLLANLAGFVLVDPWKRLFFPFQAEIMRVHLMVLALPILSLLAWAIFGERYEQVTLVLLLAIFYLLPGKKRGAEREQGSPPGREPVVD